jgi:hypothetical protein
LIFSSSLTKIQGHDFNREITIADADGGNSGNGDVGGNNNANGGNVGNGGASGNAQREIDGDG